MSVKILGGVARGVPLATPKTESTRPTSVMIRRKLFDWRQNLEGHIFIDLFAGSGSMGFEALSRGASRIYLNDSHRLAFQALKQNATRISESFKFDPSAINISSMDAMKWLSREMNFNQLNSDEAILYLDPPYENHALYVQVLQELCLLKFAGEVWIEADRLKGPKREGLTQALKSIKKDVDQGDHFVLIGKVI